MPGTRYLLCEPIRLSAGTAEATAVLPWHSWCVERYGSKRGRESCLLLVIVYRIRSNRVGVSIVATQTGVVSTQGPPEDRYHTR